MTHWTENLTTHERRTTFGGLTNDKMNAIEDAMARRMEAIGAAPLTTTEARIAELNNLEATRRLTDAEDAELTELQGAGGEDW